MRLRGMGRSAGFAAIMVCCWSQPAAADAGERFAAPAGAGTACTATAPCEIQVAVEAAGSGDTVTLAPGDYSAGPQVGEVVVVPQGVTVRGAPGQPVPRLLSSAPTAVHVAASGAVIRRLEIVHSTSPSPGAIGLSLAGGRAEQIVVREHTDFAPACGSEFVPGPYTIRDSFCLHTFGGNAFELVGSNSESRAELVNVTAASSGGIQAGRAGNGIHVVSEQGSTALVEGTNVIANINGSTLASGVSAVESSGSDAVIVMTSSNYLDESQRTGTEITDPGSGSNQTAFPKFVDRPNGDYHQRSDSPTIDAGTSPANMGPVDVDGEPRHFRAIPDIGADEFLDGDGDGVADRIDACPGTAAATADGCPAVVPPSPTDPGPAPQQPDEPVEPGPEPTIPPAGEGENVLDDRLAPQTRITAGPRRVRRGRAAVFVLAASEEGARFECRLDGAPFAACAKRSAVRGLRAGRHSFEARAIDAAGNADPTPARNVFRVLGRAKRR